MSVREKFDKWHMDSYNVWFTEQEERRCFDAFQAGRESMREEAAAEAVRFKMLNGVMEWVHQDAGYVAEAIRKLP